MLETIADVLEEKIELDCLTSFVPSCSSSSSIDSYPSW